MTKQTRGSTLRFDFELAIDKHEQWLRLRDDAARVWTASRWKAPSITGRASAASLDDTPMSSKRFNKAKALT
jgi:hypothetical protein